MAEEKQVTTYEDGGKVIFADEVVSIIAGLAASEVKGVAGMSAGIWSGLAEKLGNKNLSKGVKVEVGEKQTRISVYILIEYGARIPVVAADVQDSVKKAIETMTGLQVVSVDIYVQGIVFDKEPAAPKEKEQEVPALL